MPTRKQLHKIWKTQFQLFGGQGIPPQAYDGPTEGNGLTEQRFTDKPIIEENLSEFTGQVVGQVHYDRDRREITIVPKSKA